MAKFEFEPWKNAPHQSAVCQAPNVSEPPCRFCEYWNPIYIFDDNGRGRGVRLCHRFKEQTKDFSCYVAKEVESIEPAEVERLKMQPPSVVPEPPLRGPGWKRIGKFRLDLRELNEEPRRFRRLLSYMVVVEAIYDCIRGRMNYTAYSPLFPTLDDSGEARWYEAVKLAGGTYWLEGLRDPAVSEEQEGSTE